MNLALSPARLKAVAIVLVLLLTSQTSVIGFQRSPKPPKKKPLTSADADFDPAKVTKLAVVVVGGTNGRASRIQTDQQRLVEDEFVQVLIEKGYTLVSRSDIASVIKEQQFQRSGLTEDNAAALGKLLNVPAVLVLRITESATENSRNNSTGKMFILGRAAMGARLVSVETGGIWWTGTHSESGQVRGRGDAGLVLADVAKNLALAMPNKGPSSGGGSATAAFDPKILTKLAVLVVGANLARGADTQNDHQRLVEDEFLRVLLGKGYSLVSRSDMAAVIKEQNFQRSGMTEDNAAALGKLLNIPAVLVVRITECKAENQRVNQRTALVGRASVGARLIIVESGLIGWSRPLSDTQVLRSRGELTPLLARVASDIAEAFPNKDGTTPKQSRKSGR